MKSATYLTALALKSARINDPEGPEKQNVTTLK
jgi:hypothetical protein